jgi:hypothetical protein
MLVAWFVALSPTLLLLALPLVVAALAFVASALAAAFALLVFAVLWLMRLGWSRWNVCGNRRWCG